MRMLLFQEERLKLKDEIKCEANEENTDSKNEYVGQEISKDEPNTDVDSDSGCDIIEIKKAINMGEEHKKKRIRKSLKLNVTAFCVRCLAIFPPKSVLSMQGAWRVV